jgi:hypothetical protein
MVRHHILQRRGRDVSAASPPGRLRIAHRARLLVEAIGGQIGLRTDLIALFFERVGCGIGRFRVGTVDPVPGFAETFVRAFAG